MQKLFYEVASLDKRCYEEFELSEDLLMEHASVSMCDYIEKHLEDPKDTKSEKSILIVAGVGNNGADGLALARLLFSKHDVKLYIPFFVKSKMAKLQLKRAELLGVNIVSKLSKCDVIVDCLFGSGLNKDLDKESQEIINTLNSYEALKIACDIPSGVNNQGQVTKCSF